MRTFVCVALNRATISTGSCTQSSNSETAFSPRFQHHSHTWILSTQKNDIKSVVVTLCTSSTIKIRISEFIPKQMDFLLLLMHQGLQEVLHSHMTCVTAYSVPLLSWKPVPLLSGIHCLSLIFVSTGKYKKKLSCCWMKMERRVLQVLSRMLSLRKTMLSGGRRGGNKTLLSTNPIWEE